MLRCFKFEETEGYYYIRNKLGYYIYAYGALCRDGVNIQTYRKNGGKNQKWLLTAISDEHISRKQENNSTKRSSSSKNLSRYLSKPNGMSYYTSNFLINYTTNYFCVS